MYGSVLVNCANIARSLAILTSGFTLALGIKMPWFPDQCSTKLGAGGFEPQAELRSAPHGCEIKKGNVQDSV